MPRVLGVDYGERRIGLALSDPSGMIAQPLTALLRRRGKRPPIAAIERVIQEHDVAELVVGLPLESDGGESDWTRETRAFADKLAQRTGLPLQLQDERMTSARAKRAVRGIGLRKKEREQKGRIDAAAAALILQAYLD
ncbi:MAG TPA: Holliday junction resolvase RuvX, partial [Longimicrobiales bacterium]|nr:Holliday junction resolvase RuvX [Longimicrobiales bacterium]